MVRHIRSLIIKHDKKNYCKITTAMAMVMRVGKTEKKKLAKPLYCLFNVRVDN